MTAVDSNPTFTTPTGRVITPQTAPECEPHASMIDWLEYGTRMGWVSEMYCGTHDCAPYTQEEEDQMEEYGEPPCSWHVRVWVDGHPTDVQGGREGWNDRSV